MTLGKKLDLLEIGGRNFGIRSKPAHTYMLGRCSFLKIQQACNRSMKEGSSSSLAETPV
jgi:hypothetical protein